MPFVLEYILAGIIVSSVIALIYRAYFLPNQPDFLLSKSVSDKEIKEKVIVLAREAVDYNRRGRGLGLDKIAKKTKQAFLLLEQKSIKGQALLGLENWVYDNYYKLAESLADLKIASKSFKRLPHFKGKPRLYALCSLLLSSEKQVEFKSIKDLVSLYSSIAPLKHAEALAVGDMVRYCILETVAIFCDKIIEFNSVANQAVEDAKTGSVSLNLVKNSCYLSTLYASSDEANKIKIAKLAIDNDTEVDLIEKHFLKLLEHYEGALATSFKSLHTLEATFTNENVLKLCPVHNTLKNASGILYNNLTLDTKYSYLYHIAQQAKKNKVSELHFVELAIKHAKTNELDIAHFILPGAKPKILMAGYIFFYLFFVAVLALAVWITAFYVSGFMLATMLLSLPILFMAVGFLANFIFNIALKGYNLPSVSLKGDFSNCSSIIVMPRLVLSKDEIADAFKNLETIIAANPSHIFSYGLVFDFKESDKNWCENDDDLLSFCKTQYNNSAFKNRILLFVRGRVKSHCGKKYTGYEKKRGALVEFNSAILNKDTSKFKLFLGELKSFKYAITLDCDTLLLNAINLIKTLEHPFNSEVSVLSLSMRSNLTGGSQSIFSRFFNGASGLSRYSESPKSLANTWFKKGNFTGKGAYRIKEFSFKTASAFLDNRVLCHDFLEGSLAGCSDSGVSALDEFPNNFSSFFKRELRWQRGDTQLVPFLMPNIKDKTGQKYKNPLSALCRFNIFLNILRPLVPIFSMGLLVLGLFLVNPFLAIGIALLPYALPFVFSIFTSIRRLKPYFLTEFIRQAFLILALPTIAFNSLIAFVITIFRLASGKKLLEWKTFSHQSGRVLFWANLVVAVALAVGNFFLNASIAFYIIAGLFLLGFFIGIAFDFKPKQKPLNHALSQDSKLELLKDFKKQYSFFTKAAGSDYNYLVCDNFQFEPSFRVAMRTSPTNIGFSLLVHASAFELRVIDKTTFNLRVERIIEAVERLEKFKGNLYNWYCVKSLVVLPRRYVSAVDSGNFLLCLILIAQYLDGELKIRVDSLIKNTRLDTFLDTKRELLFIGYNDELGEFDKTHYDLLASEALSTYLIAIGLGQLKPKVFNNLSTQSYKYKGKTALASWTGGAFEYLMPSLFYNIKTSSNIFSSNLNAVKSQIAYAKSQKLPAFGVSESQYDAQDECGNYQYKAFGVPNIALSTHAECTSVVSPYSSYLSLSVLPMQAYKNITTLKQQMGEGEFGLYEAIDFSSGKVLKTHMAHHLGMSVGAICNFLTDGALVKKMQQSPFVRASEILIATKENKKARKKNKICAKAVVLSEPPVRVCSGNKLLPELNLLSCDDYALVCDGAGGGYAINNGDVLYRQNATKLLVELNGKKINLLGGQFSASFKHSEYLVEDKTAQLNSSVRVSLLADGLGEKREVVLTNTGTVSKSIKLSSKLEPVLRTIDGDIAHRAFSDLFIKASVENVAGQDIVITHRKTAVNPIYFTHFCTSENFKNNTSRSNFYDRSGKIAVEEYPTEPVISSFSDLVLEPKKPLKLVFFTLTSKDKNALISKASELISSPNLTREPIGVSLLNSLVDTKAIELAKRLLYFSSLASPIDGLQSDKFNLDWTSPIVCLELDNLNNAGKIKLELERLVKLYKFGLRFNIYVIYNEPHSYYKKQYEALNELIDSLNFKKHLSVGSGIFLVNEFNEAKKVKAIRARNLLKYAVKNEIVKGDSGSDLEQENSFKANQSSSQNNLQINPQNNLPTPNLIRTHPLGGFTTSGGFYMDLSASDTPRPFSNVIANKHMGTIVTESGGGFSFYDSSYYKKITHWSNDAVLDTPSEFIVLNIDGQKFSTTKKPFSIDGANYSARHELGYSEFMASAGDINSTQKIFLSQDKAIKFFDLELNYSGNIAKKINATLNLDLVLGDFKANTRHALSLEKADGGVVAVNLANNKRAYISCNLPIDSFKINKNLSEFSVNAILNPNQKTKIIFSVGAEVMTDFSGIGNELNASIDHYNNLSCIEIHGNSTEALISKWLPYQVLNSRFYAKAGFYQAGGAIGFRDQLQDCLAVLYIDPQLVRSHIIEASKRQFSKGDVLHWWHPVSKGVRTLMTDDRLFLPLVTAEYIDYTQDFNILSERTPYLEDKKVPAGQHSLYDDFSFSEQSDSLLNHCLKAIEVSCDFGDNGLVKMGTGDWNDAMDRLGERGEGTSMFNSMLLYFVINKFNPFIKDAKIKRKYLEVAENLKTAIDENFETDRYIRAVTDDGDIVGSKSSAEGKIDMLVQAWSALSNAGQKDKVNIALSTVLEKLVDEDKGIAKLLAPPFENQKNIGYIADYPPGVRENGGQYSHAATWFVLGLLKEDRVEEAYKIFNMMNPINLTATIDKQARYKNEPYVLSADVYTNGQGGWSWYTGAASWYYKCLIEGFLGITKKGNKVWVSPKLPDSLTDIKFSLRHGKNKYNFTIDNSKKTGDWKYKVGLVWYSGNGLDLTNSLADKDILVVRA